MGAFMSMHKQKREEAVRQSEKFIAENVKIEEKKKELRAKKQRLERLETKVIYDCVIGMLTLSLPRQDLKSNSPINILMTIQTFVACS